jgi:hypothetical protein
LTQYPAVVTAHVPVSPTTHARLVGNAQVAQPRVPSLAGAATKPAIWCQPSYNGDEMARRADDGRDRVLMGRNFWAGTSGPARDPDSFLFVRLQKAGSRGRVYACSGLVTRDSVWPGQGFSCWSFFGLLVVSAALAPQECLASGLCTACTARLARLPPPPHTSPLASSVRATDSAQHSLYPGWRPCKLPLLARTDVAGCRPDTLPNNDPRPAGPRHYT